jgi:hypothetical protein
MTKAVLLVGVLFAATACDVGSVPPNGAVVGTDAPIGTTGGLDGGSGSGSDSGGTPNFQPGVPVARATQLTPKHLHIAGGSDNAGLDCMTCHAAGGTAGIEFDVAGTMYGSDGVTPDPGGAWVEIQPGGSGAITGIVTDTGGNFYWGPGEGEPALVLPANTCITAAPTLTPMGDPVQLGQGGCNSCHANPPQNGAPGVITLTAQ